MQSLRRRPLEPPKASVGRPAPAATRLVPRGVARKPGAGEQLRDTTVELSFAEEEASVTKKTHQAYCRLLKDFQRSEGLPHLGVAADILDAKLVRFFDRLMLEGRGAGAGGKVLSAVQFWVPSFAHHGQLHLPRAHRSLRGWKRLMPGRTRRPLPWAVIAAAAWNPTMQGRVGKAL